MPFQDFQGSDDAIVSRLEFDVDEKQVLAMKSITTITDSLKTNLESIVRFSESFDNYLKLIPEISRVAEKAQEITLKQMSQQKEVQDQLLEGQKTFIQNFKDIMALQREHSEASYTNSVPVAAVQSPMLANPGVAQNYQPRHAAPAPAGSPAPAAPSQAPGAPATPSAPTPPADNTNKQELQAYIEQVASESIKRQQKVRDQYSGMSERELVDVLRARGLSQESMKDGKAQLNFRLPSGTVDATELGHEGTRSRVLDYLSQEEKGESGGIAQRMVKAGKGLGNIADFARKDTKGQITQATDFIGGLGKSGGVLDAASAGGGITGGLADGAMAGVGLASKAIPYVGAAVTAYEGFEKGAQVYQGFKNEGSVVGGGASEGFQIEAGIRTMAMNPFISTEQARQIMMAGLQDGAKGKQLDMMTDYLSKNLTDMNISVGDSMKMMKTNVQQGGESISQLSNQLSTLQEMAKGSNTSFQDMQKQFQQVSKAGTDQGMSGTESGNLGLTASGMFQDNDKLKNKGGDIVTSLMNNQGFMAQVGRAEGIGGDPAEVAMKLNSQDKINDGMNKVLKQRAEMFKGSPGRFWRWLQSQGLSMTINDAAALQQELLSKDNIFEEGKKEADKATEVKKDEGNMFTNALGGAWNATKAVGGAAKGAAGVAWGSVEATANTVSGGNIASETGWGSVKKSAEKDFGAARNDMAYAEKGNHGYLDKLVDNYGAKNVYIDTGKGDATSFESMDFNDDVFNKLNSGEYKIKTKKDGKTQEGTIKEFAAGGGQISDNKGIGASALNGGDKPQSVQLNLDLSEQAKNLFHITSPNANLSNNQIAANTAHGGATANNPNPDNGR